MMLGVNYVGPYYLSHLLLPALRASGGGRIVNVSSDAYRYGKIHVAGLDQSKARSFRGYARSKIAINLFTMHFAELSERDGPTVNALHPGHVATNIWDLWPNRPRLGRLLRAIARRTGQPASIGAGLVVHLAVSPEVSAVTGHYFRTTVPERFQGPCTPDLAAELYDWTKERLGL